MSTASISAPRSSTDTGSNVIDFHKFREYEATAEDDRLVDAVIRDPRLAERVRNVLEAYVFERIMAEQLDRYLVQDDPFGSVYLADLQPDLIERSEVKQITLLSKIEDRSDELSFDDGWDD